MLAEPGRAMNGLRIQIRGIVQGVGFRPWVYRVATEEGIAGRIRNDSAGVTIDAFGGDGPLGSFLRRLETSAPPAAEVRELVWSEIEPENVYGFVITPSAGAAQRNVSIPPDLATCEDCLDDISDPENRRFRYAFTNCTNCGPRFTIARDIPYDRAATTMAPFEMCDDCSGEYGAVEDRRFHAQPNACPRCGPRLTATDVSGNVLDGDPILLASHTFAGGMIVAVKGLGGFHLACDATSPDAVTRLRRRKRRDEKPFAVMVRSLAEAETLGELTESERRALRSVERPIVLVRRRPETSLAEEVAPGNPLLGLMLPYTPLHHLLLDAVGRPLVMTSGNLSEEPIAQNNDEAYARLGEIADLMLVHDREIETRCDDSVVRVLGPGPVILRRSRGWVPRPVTLARPVSRPILACGAHLKNTFAFADGSSVTLGPHIGDLENLETLSSYEASIDRMQRFLELEPAAVAHDLHPDYLSTRYAESRGEPRVAIQHHHAHVAGAMAEHGIDGPAIGIAWDGTGFGTDGTAWGGEILLAEYHRFDRIATLRPISLAGGDAAIRKIWRIALAALDDAFDGSPPIERLPLFDRIPEGEIRVVRQMLATKLNSAQAHGAGRYFDAFGAIFLGRERSAFEGQVSMEWNLVASPGVDASYSFDIDSSRSPWEIDLRPCLREAVTDLFDGTAAAEISAKFHETLVRAAAAVVEMAEARWGRMPVVYSGGCFQNDVLVERLLGRLTPGYVVRGNRQVPPGDGGIAFGQAVVADAILRQG
jgi:hydrogenase maturation protein HypF